MAHRSLVKWLNAHSYFEQLEQYYFVNFPLHAITNKFRIKSQMMKCEVNWFRKEI